MVATQAPARQASPVEHMLASSQAVPSGLATLTHWPVAALHVPAVWHESVGAGQTTAAPATQVPPWQVSPLVQLLLSEQAVPLATAGVEHTPEVASQVPAVWQESAAVQTLATPPEQAPAWQVSPVVQALPSEQVAPFGAAGFEQVP